MENETFRLRYSSKLFPEVSIKIFFAHTLRYHPQTFLICGLWKSVTFKKHIIFKVSYIPSLDASQLVTGREYYMINYKWLLNPMIINAKWKLGSTSCLEQAKWILTFWNLEKVVSSWSAKLLLSLTTEMSCLFSSQVPPMLFFLDENLKLVEVHQVFLRHFWPHDNKLGESNRLITYPISLLFWKASK